MRSRVLWQGCVVAAVGCLASGLALAQSTVAQSTVDCSTVTADMARLKCYDEQAAQKKKATQPPATAAAPAMAGSPATAAPSTAARPAAPAASAAPAAPSAATSPHAPAAAPLGAAAAAAAAPAASGSSDFGLSPDLIRKKHAATNSEAAKESEQLIARVTAVATKVRGAYRITLENGQIWEETQHSSVAQPPNVGDTVTIKHGLLGSYFLSHSAGLSLRVKRIN